MSSPEQQPTTPENNVEVPRVSAEQYEQLTQPDSPEISKESTEKRTEKARTEVERVMSKERPSTVEKERKPSTAKRRGAISKKERSAAYKRHMKQVQAAMNPAQRAFSRFIHAQPVEKASEFVGSTVARPNSILFGAIAGFALVLAVYLIAKNLGYVLSGFETIGAFIAGWILGILYDFLRTMITGKKS